MMAKILVVDDELAIVALVTKTLAGHEILTAANGEEGLALARDQKPDLVILDVSMPKLSGTEVCIRLKKDPGTAQIPVLMLTGAGTVSNVEEAFANKADDYIIKPFPPKALRARVEILLAKKKGPANP
jgi:DNA-binding response OmpR family regulator